MNQARQTGMGAFNQVRQQGMGALGQVQNMGRQGFQQVCQRYITYVFKSQIAVLSANVHEIVKMTLRCPHHCQFTW